MQTFNGFPENRSAFAVSASAGCDFITRVTTGTTDFSSSYLRSPRAGVDRSVFPGLTWVMFFFFKFLIVQGSLENRHLQR